MGVDLLRPFHLRQQIEMIAPQLAPGGQQRVAELLLAFGVKQARRVIRSRNSPAHEPGGSDGVYGSASGQESVILNVAPVITTGLVNIRWISICRPSACSASKIDRRQRRRCLEINTAA